MSLLAATTLAALLIGSPSLTDADRLAANGGFLLGSAQRCGIESSRVVRAGRLVRALIAAAARDPRAADDATDRFSEFFLVSAFQDPSRERPVASCRAVARELTRLERHRPMSGVATGATNGPAYGPGDGE